MDGFPKLVTVLDSPRYGLKAYFEDGSVAWYDHDQNLWRPATAHISYADLFTRTVSREVMEPNRELAPEVGGED
jgi:hypothetical protein